MSGRGDIAELADFRAISDVAVRYCSAVDRRDWDLLAEVFTPDATVHLPRSVVITGTDEIVARYRRGLSKYDATQHMVTNHEITVDGDTATHTCLVHAQHVRHAAPPGANYEIGGRYTDRLVRTRRGWRIQHRELAFIWTGGSPAVLRPRAGDADR